MKKALSMQSRDCEMLWLGPNRFRNSAGEGRTGEGALEHPAVLGLPFGHPVQQPVALAGQLHDQQDIFHMQMQVEPPLPQPEQKESLFVESMGFAVPHEPLEQGQLEALRGSGEADGDTLLAGQVKLVLVEALLSGDTFQGVFMEQGERVRMTFKLQGFMTASCKAKDFEVQLFGRFVRNRLTEFIGRKLVAVKIGSLDKLGRRLARVMARTLQGKLLCVNDWMLASNLGVSSYLKKHEFTPHWCSLVKGYLKTITPPLTVDYC